MGRLDNARNRGKSAQEKTRSKSGGGGIGKFNFGEYQDIKWLNDLKPGVKVEIDIIPFLVTTDNHPSIEQLKKDWEGCEEIFDHYIMYYQHRNLGADGKTSIICPSTWGHPCPICEARDALMKAGKDWKDEEVRELKKVGRTLMNVVSLDEPGTIKLFDYSYAWFYENVEKKLRRIEEDEEQFWVGDITDLGKTIRCYPEESSFNAKMAGEFKDIEFIPKKGKYQETIIDKAYKLDTMLREYTYAEIEAIFNGDDTSADDDTDSAPMQTESKAVPAEIVELTPAQKRAQRAQRSKPNTEVAVPVCPHGGTFGKDNFALEGDTCANCVLVDACEKEYEAKFSKDFDDDDIPF